MYHRFRFPEHSPWVPHLAFIWGHPPNVFSISPFRGDILADFHFPHFSPSRSFVSFSMKSSPPDFPHLVPEGSPPVQVLWVRLFSPRNRRPFLGIHRPVRLLTTPPLRSEVAHSFLCLPPFFNPFLVFMCAHLIFRVSCRSDVSQFGPCDDYLGINLVLDTSIHGSIRRSAQWSCLLSLSSPYPICCSPLCQLANCFGFRKRFASRGVEHRSLVVFFRLSKSHTSQMTSLPASVVLRGQLSLLVSAPFPLSWD